MNSSDDAATSSSLFDLEPATMRVCLRCKVERPLTMFYLGSEQRQSVRVGYRIQRPCRYCQRVANRAKYKPRQAIVDEIKIAAGCTDCGIRNEEHPEIFDFDHLPGAEKTGGVAAYLTKGTVDDLMAEIAKCEVVCANCHRIRTWSRRQIHWFGNDRGPEESVIRNPRGLNGRN